MPDPADFFVEPSLDCLRKPRLPFGFLDARIEIDGRICTIPIAIKKIENKKQKMLNKVEL